jgi:hypothetical protein
MGWVLLLFFSNGTGEFLNMERLDFNLQNECEAARTKIVATMGAPANDPGKTFLRGAVCVNAFVDDRK